MTNRTSTARPTARQYADLVAASQAAWVRLTRTDKAHEAADLAAYQTAAAAARAAARAYVSR